MGHGKRDMMGLTIGRLTVTAQGPSAKNGQAYWVCLCECGNEKVVKGYHLRSGAIQSCGCLAREVGRERGLANWKGGTTPTKGGYVRYTDNETQPELAGKFVHRVVMEKMLGRPLLDHETVHHKNGVRNDNREENLELMSSSHPKGQRVADKVAWAKELLALYEPTALV